MTEHEKLLAGLEYDYTDPEIQGLLQKARTLAAEYNALPGGAAARRQEIMGELFGAVGEDVTVQKPFRILYGAYEARQPCVHQRRVQLSGRRDDHHRGPCAAGPGREDLHRLPLP